MKQYNNPTDWSALLERPSLSTTNLEPTVKAVLAAVKENGDAAVAKYTQRFDQVTLSQTAVSAEELATAENQLPENLKAAIQQAKVNIERFHAAQKEAPLSVETMPGLRCWRRAVPIEKVGLYIPAGTAPLFSTVLMLGIPAKLAGCQEIILCSPPNKDGAIDPAILYTAQLVGCTKIFKIGGVQAVAAMAYGTETVPQVYKIFGPGNQYVTCAKQLLSQEVTAIDMPAGPSELLVWADEQAIPSFVAADLLSQAEHGTDSQVILVSTEASVLAACQAAVQTQLEQLPRKTIAAAALENSRAILLNTTAAAIDFINQYAPEHLILNLKDAEEQALKINNAGSVFLGNYTPESLGDYASGTNHTLPTNGFARSYSGVSLDAFVKKITYQQANPSGLKAIGWAVEAMANAEQLVAHERAVSLRLAALESAKLQ